MMAMSSHSEQRGVPVASVQETSIRASMGKAVEQNERLQPHIWRTKTPDFVHVFCGVLPMNRIFCPTSAVCLLRPTQARGVIQRDQSIQALPKDRCFLLQNYGNPRW